MSINEDNDIPGSPTILPYHIVDNYIPEAEVDETLDLLALPPDEDEPEQQSLINTSHRKYHNKDFGEKDITFLGGFCLLVNNMTGPAVAAIPAIFQESGWLTPCLMIIVMTVISSYGCTLLCEAMANIPGNEEFEGRAELSTLAKAYFNKYGYWLVHILLFISLQSLNIGAILISAQVMDETLLQLFKWTCAFEIYPHFGFAVSHGLVDGTAFAPHTIVITLGFLIVFVLTIPLGYFNLDDNIIVQKISAFLMLAIMAEWILQFIFQGMGNYDVPMITKDQTQVVGTIVFNYAFVTSIPSWVNEKKKGVGINKTVWSTNVLSSVLFLAVGWLGAKSFNFSNDATITGVFGNPQISLHGPLRDITLISAYVFPIVVLLPGIPVSSIIIRYNLMKSNLVKRRAANFLSVVLPWIVCLPFYTGSGFLNFINWVSLFVNGAINFIIPFWLYLLSYKLKAKYPPTKAQLKRTFKAMPMWHERLTRKMARFFIFASIALTVAGIFFAFWGTYGPS